MQKVTRGKNFARQIWYMSLGSDISVVSMPGGLTTVDWASSLC